MGGLLAKTDYNERRERRLAACRGTHGMPISIVRMPNCSDGPSTSLQLYVAPMAVPVDPAALPPIDESDEDDHNLVSSITGLPIRKNVKSSPVRRGARPSWWQCGCFGPKSNR